MKSEKLTTKRIRGYIEVSFNGKCVANLYRIADGFGRRRIKDGEWAINRGPLAIDNELRFPEVSYPDTQLALDSIAKVLPW